MSVYERFQYRGVTLDRMTIASLHAVEKRLGYAQTILQGSYSNAVGASAGTHGGGGAIDVVWVDIKRKTRAHREVGWAFWPRPALPGVWGAHAHGILIGNDKASAGAKDQVRDYRQGKNGLANEGRDPYWRPKVIHAFNYGRANVVSWGRLNRIAKMPGGKPLLPEGGKQVRAVERALEGFGMNLGNHKPGRMDAPLIDAINRFRRIRKVGETDVKGPLTPKVCYELCLPTKEEGNP